MAKKPVLAVNIESTSSTWMRIISIFHYNTRIAYLYQLRSLKSSFHSSGKSSSSENSGGGGGGGGGTKLGVGRRLQFVLPGWECDSSIGVGALLTVILLACNQFYCKVLQIHILFASPLKKKWLGCQSFGCHDSFPSFHFDIKAHLLAWQSVWWSTWCWWRPPAHFSPSDRCHRPRKDLAQTFCHHSSQWLWSLEIGTEWFPCWGRIEIGRKVYLFSSNLTYLLEPNILGWLTSVSWRFFSVLRLLARMRMQHKTNKRSARRRTRIT